jgi:hypothetical protein
VNGSSARQNNVPKSYETQAGDRFNDLKKSLYGPVCLQGFFVLTAGLERSAARLTLGSTDLPLLLAAIGAGWLGFPTDEVVAFASCQCRLTILVSTGGTIVATGEIDGWVGGNADWAGVSWRT